MYASSHILHLIRELKNDGVSAGDESDGTIIAIGAYIIE